ncbi:MAG: DUF4279 domain-containing protein [Candidatus Sumerlaeaceae bacterium]
MRSLYGSPVDDEYSTCRSTYATLRLYPGNLSPEEVTQALDLEPDSIQIKGRTVNGRKVKLNGWFLCSERHVQSRDSRRHISWLLDLLEPRKAAFQLLEERGCGGDIACMWDSKYGHGGPTLDPDIMRRLADLNLEIWFDVYAKDINIIDGAIVDNL